MGLRDKDSEKKKFSVHDRRFWLDEEKLDDLAAEPQEQRAPTYVEQLQQQLDEKNRTLQEYIQAHKESVSDMDDVRKRLEDDLQRRLDIEKGRLVEPFIEVLDNLKRLHVACSNTGGAAELEQGMLLVIKQLEEQLARLGIEPLDTSGQRFDPNTMEAMMTEEVDAGRDGMVIEEIRPGYRLGDRVVRPAGVKVGVSR